VGHSSDDDIATIQNFMDNGADFFEKKPTNIQNIKKILDAVLLK
jgi:hypothetical protein